MYFENVRAIMTSKPEMRKLFHFLIQAFGAALIIVKAPVSQCQVTCSFEV